MKRKVNIYGLTPFRALLAGLATVALALVAYLFEPPFLSAVSRQTFDALLKLTATPPRGDQVVIVDIDEASLREYGHWPWPRYLLQRLTDRLWEQGAAVIAFDILFAEEDRLSPTRVRDAWRAAFGHEVKVAGVPEDRWDYDLAFAAALRRGPTVLACYMDHAEGLPPPSSDTESASSLGHCYERGAVQRGFLPQANVGVHPIPALASAASGVAFINATVDRDNILRRTPLVYAFGPDRIYPSLAVESVRLFLGGSAFGIVYDDKGVAGVKNLQIKDRTVPTDSHGRLVLNYRSARFPRISARDVLAGAPPPHRVTDRIVLVGTSAAGLHDLMATPLGPELPGIEVQATAIENVLRGDMLREPRWMFFANLVAIVILGSALTLLISRATALQTMAVTAVAAAGVFAASAWALRSWHLVSAPAEVSLSLLAIYVVVSLVKYRGEERARQRVRAMFGAMVSDQVLQYLEEHPESFSLSGIKAEATVFFSDIAGFMTIAESLDPQALQEMINRYLTPVTEIIMSHQGFVNRYIGDAVLAAWNVPYPVERHALQACLAALEQQQRIAELRSAFQRDYGHVLRVRMGINTGAVTVGYMGSERRREYTLLGDAVNLASRFETANRDYGTSIIVGEATYAAAREHVDARLLDLVVVRGESQPVYIYELLGRKGEVSAAKLDAARLYEAALRLHWERKWDEAQERLRALVDLGVEDPPASMLRQRIEHYRLNPPPPGWRGEYVKPTK